MYKEIYKLCLLQALDEEISRLKLEVSSLETKLVQETSAHDQTREELDSLTAQLRAMTQEEASRNLNLTTELETARSTAQAELKAKDEVGGTFEKSRSRCITNQS